MSATAHATDQPVRSSRGRDKTKATRPVVADGQLSAPPDALLGTSTSTTETIQASSANATDFFNGLLGSGIRQQRSHGRKCDEAGEIIGACTDGCARGSGMVRSEEH